MLASTLNLQLGWDAEWKVFIVAMPTGLVVAIHVTIRATDGVFVLRCMCEVAWLNEELSLLIACAYRITAMMATSPAMVSVIQIPPMTPAIRRCDFF